VGQQPPFGFIMQISRRYPRSAEPAAKRAEMVAIRDGAVDRGVVNDDNRIGLSVCRRSALRVLDESASPKVWMRARTRIRSNQ
jgi:hypothetical protein